MDRAPSVILQECYSYLNLQCLKLVIATINKYWKACSESRVSYQSALIPSHKLNQWDKFMSGIIDEFEKSIPYPAECIALTKRLYIKASVTAKSYSIPISLMIEPFRKSQLVELSIIDIVFWTHRKYDENIVNCIKTLVCLKKLELKYSRPFGTSVEFCLVELIQQLPKIEQFHTNQVINASKLQSVPTLRKVSFMAQVHSTIAAWSFSVHLNSIEIWNSQVNDSVWYSYDPFAKSLQNLQVLNIPLDTVNTHFWQKLGTHVQFLTLRIIVPSMLLNISPVMDYLKSVQEITIDISNYSPCTIFDESAMPLFLVPKSLRVLKLLFYFCNHSEKFKNRFKQLCELNSHCLVQVVNRNKLCTCFRSY